MPSKFEVLLLLIDKDTKFPNVLPFLKRVEVTDCSRFDPVVILSKSVDFFFFFFFCKNGVLEKKCLFSRTGEKLGWTFHPKSKRSFVLMKGDL